MNFQLLLRRYFISLQELRIGEIMVERAFLQYIIPDIMEPDTEVKDPYYSCTWFSSHPGDEIESEIIRLLNKLGERSEVDLFHLSTLNGYYIFIKWMAEIKGGLAIVLPLFDSSSLISVSQWIKYLWEFHEVNPKDLSELLMFHSSISIDNDEISMMQLSPIWMRATLHGDKILVPMEDRKEFLSMMLLILQDFPWSIYLLESGSLTPDGFELKYKRAKGQVSFSMEELYNQLQQQNKGFWNSLQLGLSNIVHLSSEQRSHKILTYLGIILYIQKSDPDPLEALELIKENIIDILALSLDLGVSFITNVFSKIAITHPNYESCKQLLNVANKIHDSTQTDLIKLAEGTALQIAFTLPDAKKREEIFLEVTKRSKKWGNSHLIAYIQSVTGILQETEENKKILGKIVESCEDVLRDSWDGQLCLVETYLIADEIIKAISTRLEATRRLSDKIMRAEDIFGAIAWSLTQTAQEQELIDLTRDYFNQALIDIPKGQILVQQMESLVNACLENSKLHFLFQIISQVNSNQVGLELDDRMQVISMLEQLLNLSKAYIQILIHVELNKFNIFVENPAVYSYDAAEDLLRVIYNSVDPSKSNSIDLITHITNWIILSSTKTNRIDLVDEARMRFNLLINDEEYSRVTLRDIYAKAGRIRLKLPKSQLKRNGLGVKLFNEAIELCHPYKETEFLVDILPDAKSMAVKKQAYDTFVRFEILEVTLLQHLNEEWLDKLLEATDVLIDNGALQAVRELFNHALNQNLDSELTTKVIAKQLSYVEIEPDLFTSEEIYDKRNQLITLKSDSADKKTQNELLDHYRYGISELMSKGDIEHLSDLVIQAIIYCHTNHIDSINEFSNILKDSFMNNINTYQETKSSRVYKSVLSLLRKINDNFRTYDLDHIAQYTSTTLRTNLELYGKTHQSVYLQRSKNLVREIAIVIRDGNRNNLEISPEVREVLVFEVNSILDSLDKSKNIFGKIDSMNLSAHFYYNIGDTQTLFTYLNETLSHLKREIVKSKQTTSTIAIALLVLSEIYLKIEADLILELCIPLQQQALRLIDVILTLPMSKEFSKLMNDLKDRMESSPQQTFQEYPFEIETILQTIDGL